MSLEYMSYSSIEKTVWENFVDTGWLCHHSVGLSSDLWLHYKEYKLDFLLIN